jgi:hypothetical protein
VTVIVGLILLLVAAIVATTGLLTDVGGTYASSAVFGDQFTGSASTLFLCGVVIGAAVLLGLVVLPADPLHTTARGRDGRGGGPTPPDVTRRRCPVPLCRAYQGRIACTGLLFEKGSRYEGDRCQ